MTTKNQEYDIVGDLHGQADKLTALLEHLNYRPHGNHYRHPEGRKVIFLGDFIDRGPKIRETLHLVRNMVEASEAFAIAGNHELNAVFFHTPDGIGGYLRSHNKRHTESHAATLAAFTGREEEWADWLDWMKRLPLFLDLGALRAVHAAWDEEAITFLRGKTLADADFLRAAATEGTPEFDAVETTLKGPELPLPDGVIFYDKENIARNKVRVRWWNIKAGMTVGEIVVPEKFHLPRQLRPEDLERLPNYPADAPPVFFGHYWMPPNVGKTSLAANVVCLDYSAAFGDNPLTAYRWNGFSSLDDSAFVAGAGKYQVYEEIFIYTDERDRRTIGNFVTSEAAVNFCKSVIDADIARLRADATGSVDLYYRYLVSRTVVEISGPGSSNFSSGAYAQSRVEEIARADGLPHRADNIIVTA